MNRTSLEKKTKTAKHMVELNRDITAVTFSITLSDVTLIENEFTSREVYIRGLPWNITLTKKPPEPEDDGQPQLAIYLYVLNNDQSNDWAIFATATIKIITSKIGEKPFEGIIEPFVFSSQCTGWGEHSFISWNKFIDPANGYINNGTCKLEVKIETGPLQDVQKDDWMKFERIESCCGCTSIGRFRLTVKNFSEFADVCSPQFELPAGIPWSILILKSDKRVKNNDTVSIVPSLRIQLYNRLDDDDDEGANRSCRANMHCKLVSFDPNVNPILAKIENMEFKSPYVCKFVDILAWDELNNIEKKFIQNNSFIIEIEIKIESANGFPAVHIKTESPEIGSDEMNSTQTNKRRLSEVNRNIVEMECFICNENMIGKVILMTKCGHMYCK